MKPIPLSTVAPRVVNRHKVGTSGPYVEHHPSFCGGVLVYGWPDCSVERITQIASTLRYRNGTHSIFTVVSEDQTYVLSGLKKARWKKSPPWINSNTGTQIYLLSNKRFGDLGKARSVDHRTKPSKRIKSNRVSEGNLGPTTSLTKIRRRDTIRNARRVARV